MFPTSLSILPKSQSEIEGYKNGIAAQENNIQKSIARTRTRARDSDSANGAPPSQPGATPQGTVAEKPSGLKARSIVSIVMSQSLSLVIIHVIFSTKDRHPFLDPDTRPRLHAYLSTVARNLGCEAYRVGGVADHVHLAIRLSRTVTIADLVQELKTSSSRWVKKESPGPAVFSWQRGYGCFSVGPSDLEPLRAYIDDQEKHHETRTFQDEFRMFLNKYGVEYDEAYVWD